MDTALLTKELLDAVSNLNRNDVLSKLNISLKGEDLFLVMLSEMGGVSTPSRLAEDSEFTPSRLSAIIKNLENKGYIEKKSDEIDKRCSIIELTDEGLERSEMRREEIIKNAVNIIEVLGEPDASEFVRLTKRLISIISEA